MFIRYYMNSLIKPYKIIILFWSFSTFLFCNELNSLNIRKELSLVDALNGYSFLVAGHTYGTPSASLFPAASLIYGIDNINNLDIEFFILLGDIIQHQIKSKNIGELEIEIFKKTIVEQVSVPILNSPGNHDVVNRELYDYYFGKSFFDFQIGSEIFIVLDSEIIEGDIKGEQLNYILELLESVNTNTSINNIFIFIHKTLWAVNNPILNTIDPWVNGPRKGKVNNFEEKILPKLDSISNSKDIYIMSGDIGIKNYILGKFPQESFSLFYHKDKNNITYLASGLAENNNDAVIKVNISSDGVVSFKPISLLGDSLNNIEHYGISYWNNIYGKELNNFKQDEKSLLNNKALSNSFFIKIKKLIIHRYFFYGYTSAVLSIIFLFFFYIRIFNKKP